MGDILPAEHVGTAKCGADGWLTIGPPDDPGGQVRINLNRASDQNGSGWFRSQDVPVYVRRYSYDLSVAEIHMARHDGIFQEELDEQNRQAEAYALGPKEYWRGEMVGKYTYGTDGHLMTDADFEEHWHDEDNWHDEDDEPE
jgi:hypothetical protein